MPTVSSTIRKEGPVRAFICSLTVLAVVAATGLAAAADLPTAGPEAVGLSSERLERVTAVLEHAVASGELPGAVALVARQGRVAYHRSFGMQDKTRGVAMAKDSIFRIYSMTKPLVSVAAMILVEEGRLALYEPVAKYLPEFKDVRVGVERHDPATGARTFYEVKAARQMTVQDLLRHTSGLVYGGLGAKTAVRDLYKQAGMGSLDDMYRETGESQTPWTNATFAAAIAKLPLQYEPGTTWEYGHSTDVLGRVVEVASGQPLDAFLSERIFKPLGMNDTGFSVPPDNVHRLAQAQADPKTGEVPFLIDVTRRTTWFAGGHGGVSTVPDYLYFCQMLLNGGVLDGARILGARTVAWMTSNHLNPAIGPGSNYLPGPGHGFGLGFAVRLDSGLSDWPGSVGDYFWGGYAGTYFWIDPKEQLIAILMFQDPSRRAHYRMLFRATVLQALVE
jgi:CubicO group peptidase (beta-lactamase class C family)